MKKILLLCVSLLMAVSASAQMKIVDGSFKDRAAGNRAAGEGLGRTDMTAETIEWPTDADGEETLGLLIVYFENMAPDDIKAVTASLSGGKIVAKTDTRVVENRTTRWFFIPESRDIDVLLTHERFGSDRLSGIAIKKKNIYEVTVRNAATVSVSITSDPAGARVIFDGQEQGGVTPLTLRDVMMGPHTISLHPANPKIAVSVPERTIEVSSARAAFNFPMLKKKTVVIESSPADSKLWVLLNDATVVEGEGRVVLEDAPYERTYKIKGLYKESELVADLTIDENTPDVFTLKVIGSRSVSFFAKQNNSTVDGAAVTINGRSVGVTPLTQVLDYGHYTVDMSYAGYHKTKRLKVDKKTTECMIALPNHKTVAFNPFNIDYHKREWGLAVNYINRYYTFKVDGKNTKYNWFGEDGTDSGVQVGIVYQPYFGYGQGLSTGLYWQGTFGSSDDISYQEHALYMPVQYQFRLPLHRNFSVLVNAGVGLTLGVSNTAKIDGYDETFDLGYGYNSDYETYFPESFDYSLLLGAGIQFKSLQLEGKYSMGLKDHDVMYTAGDSDKVSYKSGFWSISLSLLF